MYNLKVNNNSQILRILGFEETKNLYRLNVLEKGLLFKPVINKYKP